jgi:chaperonin GroES
MAAPDPNTIHPLGDRLLVETIIEEETRGGIVIPDMAQGRPERARVLAVGPGRRTDQGELIPMEIAVGDEVIFHRHAGTQVGSFDDNYIIFREQDILARVVESDL